MRGLLEIINSKYVAEIRKDSSKQAEFIHSKYSLMDGVLNVDEKFLLKDILSLVQTALMKMYIEADMQEKIHEFFSQISSSGQGVSAEQSQIYFNIPELERYLDQPQFRAQPREITQIALALIHEYTDNYDKALEIWSVLRSKEGCERTVTILKKLGSKDKILKYAKWVFETDPQTGLKLFVTNTKEQSDDLIGNTAGINMSKDEVLQFLEEI